MPVTITTRAAKGSALSHAEMDANLSNLKAAVDLAKKETTLVTANTVLGVLNTIIVNATTNPVTLTLPPVATSLNKTYTVKRIDSAVGNMVVVDGNASETIDGGLTTNLTTQYHVVHLICDGVTWHKI